MEGRSLEGVAAMELDREREREGTRKIARARVSSAIFRYYPFFRLRSLFRPLPRSPSSVFFDDESEEEEEEEDRKRFSIRASRPVIDCLYRGPDFDSRGQRTPPLVFIESRGDERGSSVPRMKVLYLYTLAVPSRRGESVKRGEGRQRRRINFLDEEKDVIKNKG